jgi:L-amino acid N-acyltransferase YncA
VQGAALPWLVLEDDRRMIGYAYATKWRAKPAYQQTVETTVYLADGCAGQGWGKLLYAQLLAELTAADRHTALGCIALPNAASVRLHETLGFKKVTHFQEVDRKFGQWIDVGF